MKPVPIAVNTYKRFGKKSREQLLDRAKYAAMLRDRTPSAWRDLPATTSIPDVRPRKSPSSPTNKDKL
jgi:hypothetical protein